MTLSVEQVVYGFGRTAVLDEMTFEVDESEWLAIIGANGSGRTTLAEILAGLRRPHEGRVLVSGHDIWRHSGQKERCRLGLVMQRAEDQFLGDTVYSDIAFGPRQRTWDTSTIDEAVGRALRTVDFDVDEVRDRSPLEFSGGQRRRLAVAGIVALAPQILILDEPFAGLDQSARQDMVELLKRLRRDEGMTVITLTSDLDLVSEATRIGLLLNGGMALVGDIRDFVANQRLCREAGVMLPERIRIALELRDRGWNVPVLGSNEALEAAIAQEWLSRHGHRPSQRQA